MGSSCGPAYLSLEALGVLPELQDSGAEVAQLHIQLRRILRLGAGWLLAAGHIGGDHATACLVKHAWEYCVWDGRRR